MRRWACPGEAAGAREHTGGGAVWPASTELPPARSTSAQASPGAVLSERPSRRTSPVTAFHPDTEKERRTCMFLDFDVSPHILLLTLSFPTCHKVPRSIGATNTGFHMHVIPEAFTLLT